MKKRVVPAARPIPNRILAIVATDAANVMRRLDRRRDDMVEFFGRKRDRSALVDPLHSWMKTADFQAIREFTTTQLVAVNAFYEELDDLVWYLRHTDDMPGTLATRLDAHLETLHAKHERMQRATGLAPTGIDEEEPIVSMPNAKVVKRKR